MHIAPSATQVYLQNLSMRCFESVNDATYTRLVRSQNQPPSDGSSLYPQVINYNNYSPSYRGHISTLVFTPRPGLSDDSPKRAINVLSMCMFLWVYWGWRQIVLFFFTCMGFLNDLLCTVRCSGSSVVQLDHITLRQCQRKWCKTWFRAAWYKCTMHMKVFRHQSHLSHEMSSKRKLN